MRWRQEILSEIAAHIVRLGLTQCPVCESGTLTAYPRPIILPIGGVPWPVPNRADPEPGSNILFMVMVRCEVCGHALLFDSERFHHGDTYTLEQEPS